MAKHFTTINFLMPDETVFHAETRIRRHIYSFNTVRPVRMNNLCTTPRGGGRVVRRRWVNFQCRGVLLIWIIVGQGTIALAVGAGGVVLTFFLSFIFSFSFSFSGRRPDID